MTDSEKVIIPKRYTSQFKQAKEILESENGGLGDDAAGLIFTLIKELGAVEAKLARFRNPKIYEGPYYAVVDVPEICPECDGKSWISCGTKGMCCPICFLIRDLDAAEASLAALVAQQKAMRTALEMPIGHAEWWSDWPVSDLSPAHQAERIIKRRLDALAIQEKGGKA